MFTFNENHIGKSSPEIIKDIVEQNPQIANIFIVTRSWQIAVDDSFEYDDGDTELPQDEVVNKISSSEVLNGIIPDVVQKESEFNKDFDDSMVEFELKVSEDPRFVQNLDVLFLLKFVDLMGKEYQKLQLHICTSHQLL